MISLDKLCEVYLQAGPVKNHAGRHSASDYPSVMGLLAVYDLGYEDGHERATSA